MTRDLPQGFRPYASRPGNDGQTVVAGVTTDEDGLRQRPLVAMTGASRTVVWARELEGLEDTYQARATHCAQGEDGLYVLLQSDTDPSPSLGQTLLSVARLAVDGEVLGVRSLDLPEADGHAYSAWVGDVPAAFEWKDGRILVSGQYFLLSDPEARKPFTLEVRAHADQH